MEKQLFTSESVSCGHPDKICDQISDAVLDNFLKQDSESKVACECFITNNLLVIGGEAHTHASVDIITTAKKVLEEIGYNGTNGFNPETAVFVNTLHEQSSDIRMGVDKLLAEKQGAGDQGIMFGYACNETKEYMPLTCMLANKTMEIYDRLRKGGKLPNFKPDAKCQYTVAYEIGDDNKMRPVEIDTVVLSMQHYDTIFSKKEFYDVRDIIVKTLLSENPDYEKYFTKNTKYLINPTGRFVIGGPEGDTGLTGRKIVVDTYGGRCPHGGGAFSGKDSSKVDRSAAYLARYIAKNMVAAGFCDSLEVQLSYAIGVPEPISIFVKQNNGGTTMYSDDAIIDIIKSVFPLTPYGIITHFGLKNFSYSQTAKYGHFGRNEFPWEKTDKVGALKERFVKMEFLKAGI